MAFNTNQFSIFAIVIAAFLAMANAQEAAPAPAPVSVTAAGFSLPMSTALVAFSVAFSLFSFLKH
ncbi:hypothetical protein KSS87_000119 [Heliosperma pusillum]|nr:hypothetical protein KSS87_000119 [Heliosperma pusillum]